MPEDLVEPQAARPGLERASLGAAPDHGYDERQVRDAAHRIEQHVRAFLGGQAPDPADHEGVPGKPQHEPRRGAVERGCGRTPRVRYRVQPRPRHAGLGQAVDQRPGHRHHRVAAPERAALQPLIAAVLPAAAGEPVHRGDYGNPQPTGHARVHHIRPVAVRVDDIRPDVAAQRRDRLALPPVGAPGEYQLVCRDTDLREWCQKGMFAGTVEHGRNVHLMTRPVEPLRQRVSHPLQAPEFGGRDDLQDHHGALRRGRRPSRSRLPSRRPA